MEIDLTGACAADDNRRFLRQLSTGECTVRETMSDELVTIASFGNVMQAHLARNMLAASGIKAVLTDEATVSMAWHLTTAIHGIKLLVSETDADQAKSILAVESAEEAEAEELEDFTAREENADRAFRGAIIGVWLIPLQFYVFWLLAKVYISDERLSSGKRWKSLVAAAICLPYVVGICWFLNWLLSNGYQSPMHWLMHFWQ